MGLAAYGRPNEELRAKVAKVLYTAQDRVEYRLDPRYIHYGRHTWSDRFTDELIDLFGRPMRLAGDPILPWHEDLAWAVQAALEAAVCSLAAWGIDRDGNRESVPGRRRGTQREDELDAVRTARGAGLLRSATM